MWFQKMSIPPPYWNFLGQGVVNGKYKAKLEFLEGWGSKQKKKNLCRVGVGGMEIF